MLYTTIYFTDLTLPCGLDDDQNQKRNNGDADKRKLHVCSQLNDEAIHNKDGLYNDFLPTKKK
ncbi:MAG TPA: hypothetical protein VH593_06210 [Ktedonobacteraceae bacterium]|jgi:hypothetical protein